MTRKIPALLGLLTLCVADASFAARVPVLRQVDLPHSYYYREMFLPQLTSGPSSVAFSPDGQSVVYSMGGSLWRQEIDGDAADELTYGPGYDYQPDWSPDGRSIVFARHHADAIELWRLDLTNRKTQQLTQTRAVQLQPRYSPDGGRIAFVSTAGSGHFNLYVAELTQSGLGTPRAVIAPRESSIARYYYSTHDHTINPSWTPDGKSLVFVSNRENAYGTGPICSVALEAGGAPSCFIDEETSWRANPEVAPDGRRVLYSSYQGRQWHQLWVSTLKGEATLPLTFGEFDVTQARWSPDGRRVAYISNESGNCRAVDSRVHGRRAQADRGQDPALRATHGAAHDQADATSQGKPCPGESAFAAAMHARTAPDDAWVSADDGFDPSTQRRRDALLPLSWRMRGERAARRSEDHRMARACATRRRSSTAQVQETAGRHGGISFKPLSMPAWAPRQRLGRPARAHELWRPLSKHVADAVRAGARRGSGRHLQHHREQGAAHSGHRVRRRRRDARRRRDDLPGAGVPHQLLGTSRPAAPAAIFLTPDFSAYQQSALTSPYPHNGAVADLAHAQGALVGYVHPFDWEIVPEKEKSLTNALPVDVALGKADYIEVVGFSDHKATAAVWHRLLNLGFRLSAGAGTDAMANYASLRGPVGMNRVFLQTGGDTQRGGLAQGAARGTQRREQRAAAGAAGRRKKSRRYDRAARRDAS